MVAVSGKQRKNIHGLKEGLVGDWEELNGSPTLSGGNTSYSVTVEERTAQRMGSKAHSRLLWKKVRARGSWKLPDPGFVNWRMERMGQRKKKDAPSSCPAPSIQATPPCIPRYTCKTDSGAPKSVPDGVTA